MRTMKKAVIWTLCIVLLLHGMVLYLPIDNAWELPFYFWSIYVANRMEIPKTGKFQCKELGCSISFGAVTRLSFHNGVEVMVSIDHGGNLRQLHADDPLVQGRYAAYLDKGYIVLCFENIPVEFEGGEEYIFILQTDNGS